MLLPLWNDVCIVCMPTIAMLLASFEPAPDAVGGTRSQEVVMIFVVAYADEEQDEDAGEPEELDGLGTILWLLSC